MQNQKTLVQISTKEYEIISSGLVHLAEKEVKFKLGDLVVKYRFKFDLTKPRFIGEMINNELIITLYNSNDVSGDGKIDPVEIGNLSGRRLFTSWFVETIEENLRRFSYTFMLKAE